jgi:hypothetical protein
MEALVIDRKTLPESINSFIGAERVRVERVAAGSVILSPVIDTADYDNDTDCLCDISVSGSGGVSVQKIGFMKGKFSVPDDFDSMFKEEIEGLFSGRCR